MRLISLNYSILIHGRMNNDDVKNISSIYWDRKEFLFTDTYVSLIFVIFFERHFPKIYFNFPYYIFPFFFVFPFNIFFFFLKTI